MTPHYNSQYINIKYRIMKSMTKSELAQAAGVSMKTLQRWLSRHSEELAILGVRPRDKLLPPVAVRYIAEQYGIDLQLQMDGNGLIRPNDALNGRKRSETDNALAECSNFALSMNENGNDNDNDNDNDNENENVDENIDEVFDLLILI